MIPRTLATLAVTLVASAAVAGEADPAQVIAQLLNREREAMHRCWEKGAADDYHLAGDMLLRLALDSRGRVKKVDVAQTSISDAVLQACVRERARAWVFSGVGEDLGTIEVPLQFRAPDNQYTVRLEDAPARTPAASKLEARILLDRESVKAEKASLMSFRLMRNAAIPFHRHTGTEVIFVLEGSIEVLGLAGGKATKVGKGDAVYLPAGTAHSLRSTAPKRTAADLVVLYAPPGPERSYKDRTAPPATSVVRPEELKKPDPAAPQPRVARGAEVKPLSIAGGQGTVTILFDAQGAGDKAAYVGWLTCQATCAIPEHNHPGSVEILYLVKGKGEMKIAGETVPVAAGMAVHIPVGVKHSFKGQEALEAVQFYAPSGPEQRFKTPAPAAAVGGKK